VKNEKQEMYKTFQKNLKLNFVVDVSDREMFLEKRHCKSNRLIVVWCICGGLKFDSCRISAAKQIWKGVCGRQGRYQVQKCSFEKKRFCLL
jgi:hypothetical protein